MLAPRWVVAPVLQYRRAPLAGTNNRTTQSISDTGHPIGLVVRIPGLRYIAEVTSDRTNLSPFTKDYRGAASRMQLYKLPDAFLATIEIKNLKQA